mgnify:FL=1
MVNRKEVIEFLLSEQEFYSNQVEKLAEKIAKWETKISDAQRSIIKYKNYQDNLKGSIELIKGEMPSEYNTDTTVDGNAQRAKIIQEAKEFVNYVTSDDKLDELKRHIFTQGDSVQVYFDSYENNSKISIRAFDTRNMETIKHKTIHCHPDDVFNIHIGEAILLGRLFNFDVSKFENAPQPTEVVEGMDIQVYYEFLDDIEYEGRVLDVYENGQYVELNDLGHIVQGIDITRQNFKIINDTDAIY